MKICQSAGFRYEWIAFTLKFPLAFIFFPPLFVFYSLKRTEHYYSGSVYISNVVEVIFKSPRKTKRPMYMRTLNVRTLAKSSIKPIWQLHLTHWVQWSVVFRKSDSELFHSRVIFLFGTSPSDDTASAVGPADVAIALNDRAKMVLFDWILVKSCLCAACFCSSIKVNHCWYYKRIPIVIWLCAPTNSSLIYC